MQIHNLKRCNPKSSLRTNGFSKSPAASPNSTANIQRQSAKQSSDAYLLVETRMRHSIKVQPRRAWQLVDSPRSYRPAPSIAPLLSPYSSPCILRKGEGFSNQKSALPGDAKITWGGGRKNTSTYVRTTPNHHDVLSSKHALRPPSRKGTAEQTRHEVAVCKCPQVSRPKKT